MRYCPPARNFYRIRRILMEMLSLPRHAIRPSSTLAELIPESQRRRVRERFRAENLDVIEVSYPGRDWLGCLIPLSIVPFFLLLLLKGWLLGCGTAFGAIACLALFDWLIMKHWATYIDPGFTLEDAVFTVTSYKECKEAGYQMSQKEIYFRVREVLVESLNVERAEVTPETKLDDLIG